MNENIFAKFRSRVIPALRRRNYKRKSKRLTNRTPSIIANNCLGTFVYHNFGLEFRSPTINLTFKDSDFIRFVQNLKGYLSAELVDISDASRKYPVGELEYNGEKVEIYFVHYETFREAKEKWDERKQRVDFSNIFIIFQGVSVSEDNLERFDALPYENKMMILKDNPKNSKNVRTLKVLAREDYRPGEILNYKSQYSLRRYMDDIDYVGFLNRKK